ncbi:MAG: thioredoxin domain-containing protein, partial [Acidobacteria bacterium]|nr:thioredoxin domain-containing protein [Acidobacteriota bacterium]
MSEVENPQVKRRRWLFSLAGVLALLALGGSLVLIQTRGQKSPDSAPTAREGKPNRLIKEKSPYLLQHAHNPVDWYPWGEEAFEKARKENKPVFLSIGYSTCHWCHVMETESFSDTQVASLMNDAFVSIKVDREE